MTNNSELLCFYANAVTLRNIASVERAMIFSKQKTYKFNLDHLQYCV